MRLKHNYVKNYFIFNYFIMTFNSFINFCNKSLFVKLLNLWI